jgi:hypothetical protein
MSWSNTLTLGRRKVTVALRVEAQPTQKKREAARLEEAMRRDRAEAAKFLKYPQVRFSHEDFIGIPKAESLPEGFLHRCPIGTLFICKKSDESEVTVVGQVVNGLDALADQWGSGMSLPERFVNRYRVVVDPAIDYQI